MNSNALLTILSLSHHPGTPVAGHPLIYWNQLNHWSTYYQQHNTKSKTHCMILAVRITACHTVRHGSIKLGHDVCVDCTMTVIFFMCAEKKMEAAKEEA